MTINMELIKQGATRGISRTALVLRKYSPEILTTVGVAGGVAAAVMASRATLKAQPVIADIKANVEDVKEVHAERGDVKSPDYSKDLAYAYTRGAMEIGKVYWPAISLGGASIACIVGAHGIMQKRNAALVVAYNAVEKSFSEYRKRVAEEIGEDKAHNLRYGLHTKEEINEETGKKHITHTVDTNGISQYARFFDESNSQWQKDPNYNLMFLKCQQNYANDKLRARGHIFLNEVYDLLGYEHTKAGAIVGWVISKDGDNFVDFGIYDLDNDRRRAFVNGYERSVLLDFNVDGVIYDKI